MSAALIIVDQFKNQLIVFLANIDKPGIYITFEVVKHGNINDTQDT